MKYATWSLTGVLTVLGLSIFLPAAAPTPCSPPQVSCGCGCCSPTSDGPSSRTAYATAQPLAASFAGDAVLQSILASAVDPTTGGLSSAGSWGFVWYSASHGANLTVTVGVNGTASSSQQSASGPSAIAPIPSNWADSTVVLAATSGHRDPSATIANLIAFNVASYPQAPNQAVWAINFNGRGATNQLVSATGTYLGAQ